MITLLAFRYSTAEHLSYTGGVDFLQWHRAGEPERVSVSVPGDVNAVALSADPEVAIVAGMDGRIRDSNPAATACRTTAWHRSIVNHVCCESLPL